jgi:hypothetical protein
VRYKKIKKIIFKRFVNTAIKASFKYESNPLSPSLNEFAILIRQIFKNTIKKKGWLVLNSGNNFNDKKTIAKNNKLTTIE